jgi:rhodanese-related sulfurtransferase
MTKPVVGVPCHTMDESLLAPRIAWAVEPEGRARLIDLRGPDAVDLPRIPGARAIPLDELPSELATLSHQRPVVFVSASGRQAAAAIEVLRSAGITACAVEAGPRAWLDAGLPIESVADAQPPG